MAVPTTNISFHLITGIQAIDHAGFGQPMILRLESRYGATELTFFFEDEGLTKRLVEAINDAVKAVKPLDAASYETQARAAGWRTDEETHPGTGPYHGVVHPEGWWAPNWEAACSLYEAAAYTAADYAYSERSR